MKALSLAGLLACSILTPLLADQAQVKLVDFSGESVEEKAERMAWFEEARFGMFIHWGLYAQPAGIWKGKPVKGIGEWIQSKGTIPVKDYSPLQKSFNPVKYDPEAWVLAAKQAGMKYIVITSKHHDGFCLWNSDFTDWDMGGTPYEEDLLKPLAEACHKHGLKICWYHSIMDWHHPEYGNKAPWRGNHDNPKPDMDAYTDYMKKQLKELLTNYGDIGIVWFDGEWEAAWTHERGIDLYNYCRSLQPAAIVNNRVDKGRKGMQGMSSADHYRGDYGTPEQEIPHTGFGPGVYWESCMTMNKTWGFKKDDHQWKSATKLIHNLVDIASKGGNFLLNVGPTAEGEIPGASLERLKQMGDWMRVNGASVHGTQANPFKKLSWNGRSTMKSLENGSTRLYLHLFEWPEGGLLKVRGLTNQPLGVSLLGQRSRNFLPVSGKPGEWVIQLPAKAPNPICTVVNCTIEGAPEMVAIPVQADDSGKIKLLPGDAVLDGGRLKVEAKGKNPPNIGFWSDVDGSASWEVAVPSSGRYRMELEFACSPGSAGSTAVLSCGGEEQEFKIGSTGSYETYQTLERPAFAVKEAGTVTVRLGARDKPGEAVMNLRSITMIPES